MRATIIYLLILNSCALVYAQPPNEEWSIYSLDTNPFIGTAFGLNKIRCDSEGFIYSAGSAFYEDTMLDPSKTDILIKKYDGNGKKIWDKIIRTNSEDGLNDLIINQDGQLIVLGSSRICDNFIPNEDCLGDIELWIATLNQNTGDILSIKVISGSMLEVGNIMNITKQGEILISGTTRSNDGLFASKKDNTQENFLLKLNSDKSLAWILYYDGRINTILEKDGIIYTSGVSIDPAFENSSAWIRTYSSLNGILQNEKQFVGNGRDGLCQLALGENNIYLSISSESNNGVFSDNNGSQDIHILKLDYDLALQWSKSFGGSGRESSLSFSFDTSGNNLIACGSTFSQDGIVGPRNNISDAFIIKVDAKDGDLLWSKVLTNDMDDLFGMHAVGIDGSIYISSSWSDNPISFLADIVLLTKLQSEIELSSPNFFDIDIDVLPNPIKHIRELNIESKELFQKEVNLELVDVNGRILYNKNNVFFTAEKMSLDINLELVSGTYFLRIFNSASSITKRIIIATN